jgi:hypothetical protein
MKRILLTLGILAGFTFASAGMLAPSPVLAATPKDQVCQGIGTASGGGGCTADGTLNRIINNIIKIFSVIIGIVAVVMIMVAGFKYITANGDSGSLTSAKHTLIYAIVGLVVVAMAQFLVRFVLQQVR